MPVTPIKPYCADDVPHLIDALRDRNMCTEDDVLPLRRICFAYHTDAVTEQLVRNLIEALQNVSDR